MTVYSDLIEHIATKHAVIRVRLITNIGILFKSCHLALVSGRSRSKDLIGWSMKRRTKNGRGARSWTHVNGKSTLARLWSLNWALQSIISVGRVLSALYHVQRYKALADIVSKIWIKKLVKVSNVRRGL